MMVDASDRILFGARDEADKEVFTARVKSLLDGREPAFVWVDNTSWNHQYWNVFPVYTKGGALSHDACLLLGGYFLILHKGCVIRQKKDGFTITGGYSYGKGSTVYVGDQVDVDSDGVLSFSINVGGCGGPDIGIYYHTIGFDGFSKRRMVRTLYSPLFRLNEEVSFLVEFFPAQIQKNGLKLKKDVEVETYYGTIYSKPVKIGLQEGFEFPLLEKVDRNGYPEHYYSPNGRATSLTSGKLMLGLSGTEYVALSEGDPICFHAGENAYFEDLKLNGKPKASYLSFPASKYYTQPQLSNFYHTEGAGGVYGHAEIMGLWVKDAVCPVFPYRNGTYDAKEAERLEGLYLSPLRRERVEGGFEKTSRLANRTTYAITRHGMKAAVNNGELLWLRVASTGGMEPDIAFTHLTPRFCLGMLSNHLFLPLVQIGDLAQTPYVVDAARLSVAAAHGYKDAQKLRKLCGSGYFDKDAFQTAIRMEGAVIDDNVLNACDAFNVTVADWLFQMSPGLWEINETVFLVKQSNQKPIADYVREEGEWSVKTDPDTAALIRRRINGVIQKNEELCNENLDKVLMDRDWCGTVAFSVGIDVKTLPDELAFLANGIKPHLFQALYLAFRADGVEDGQGGNISALIHYQDEGHLNYEEERDFGFKVLSLRMEIENGKISAFSAKVELLVNRLFGAKATGYGSDTGNNIVFNGSYQQEGSRGYYAFVISQPQSYSIQASAIETVTVRSASLQTGTGQCLFVLGGEAKLYKHGGMDVFSYEQIGFEGLTITMDITKEAYGFTDQPEQFHFTGTDYVARDGSLAAGFPVAITDLVCMRGKNVTDGGFAPLRVKETVGADELGNEWYGLVWKVDSGNLGALAASSHLTLEILTAWNQNPDTEVTSADTVPNTSIPRVFVGIRIASADVTDSWALPLQGVMTLGFDSIELHGGEEYYFKFRNFSLKILGKRFPDTNNDLYLITDGEGGLGWYGAMEG